MTPLLEGSSGTHLGTTAWQQEQQQQPSHSSSPRGYLASSNGGSGAYTSGVVSYGSKGTQEGGKMSSSNAKGGAGGCVVMHARLTANAAVHDQLERQEFWATGGTADIKAAFQTCGHLDTGCLWLFAARSQPA